MHVYTKQNILEQWEVELKYNSRAELQKCQLGTDKNKTKQNKTKNHNGITDFFGNYLMCLTFHLIPSLTYAHYCKIN